MLCKTVAGLYNGRRFQNALRRSHCDPLKSSVSQVLQSPEIINHGIKDTTNSDM